MVDKKRKTTIHTLTIEDIKLISGENFVKCSSDDFSFYGIDYNLRTVKKGNILVIADREGWSATRRKRAGQFGKEISEIVRIARRKGVAGFVSREEISEENCLTVVVRDTRDFLIKAAEYQRKRFDGHVIAVTGTVGKSSTVKMLDHVLRRLNYKIKSNTGNQNTIYGIAAALTCLTGDHQVAVLECAVSGFARYRHHVGQIVKPTIAIITAIDVGQMNLIKSEHETAIFKGKIFESLANDGTAILNADTKQVEYLREIAAKHAAKLVEYGQNTEDARLVGLECGDNDLHLATAFFGGRMLKFRIPLPSLAIAYNAMAVLAAMREIGVDPEVASKHIESTPIDARTIEIGWAETKGIRFKYIDDCRNAEIPSVVEALYVLDQVYEKCGRKIIVIGGIVHMGEFSEDIHRKLADPIMSISPDLIFCYGKLIESLKRELPPALLAGHSHDPKEMARMVLEAVRDGDTVLIKGSSRNTRLKDVADAIKSGGRPWPTAQANSTYQAPVHGDGVAERPIPGQLQSLELDLSQAQTIVLCGDTSLGDSYLANPKWILHRQRLDADPLSFFDDLRPLICERDVCVPNLETVLLDRPTDARALEKDFVGWDQPDRTIATMLTLGVRAVCLANNHTKDFGPGPLGQMVRRLNEAGIATYGVGNTLEEAGSPLHIRMGGHNIYLLGALAERTRYRNELDFYSTENSAGVNPLDVATISRRLRALRDNDPSALIIVTPHWGSNYKWGPTKTRLLGKELVEAGANLVIGHGSHMVGQIDAFESGLQIFSLGNFVFNSPGRYSKFEAPPFSLVARITLPETASAPPVQIRLYPIVSDNRRTGFNPRRVSEIEIRGLHSILREKSLDCQRFDAAFSIAKDERGWYIGNT